ncbi:ribose/xylose/arabinose/galactoside ABC-type transport system permease subunit [Kaistia hirudinis]|uniref:Autoinducer 2 import system permease protein LsrC n=1 Tax=Kaistia hirudinis TaxID=1293440 RepID=A0A840AL93_9HYPH|nr:ABC transporter permease [Kaistia hirudinis]MBB3930128.1 ribose/xylose/arabinose/galactoside ABC-type transport system permease subunit [Kaistia hirudinis]
MNALALPQRSRALAPLLTRNAMIVAAVALIVAFVITSPVFGTPANAANILRQSASVLVLGLAMTLVVLIGGIDLSVGSVVLASATFSGIVLAIGGHPAIAVVAGIGVGALVGLVNAILVEGLRISPVIVTLGSMIAVRGLALIALGRFNSWVEIKGPIFDDLARRTVAGIPLDALVAILMALLVAFVLKRTTLGRAWHAVGDAPVAARLAGLRVRRLRGLAYVGCGALAGLAGVLVAARTGLISPSVGMGLEFFAIAVVALGAGGLPAGRVSALHAVVGTLILMMIFNYMTIRGVPGTWQTTVTGLLLLAAMVAGGILNRRSSEVSTGEAFRDEYAEMSPAGARLARSAVLGATVLLALVFAFVNPRFATLANLFALVEQNGTLAIIAVGAMLGIVSRTVDIAPGSVVALGAVVAALAAKAGVPVPLALLVGILACIAVYGLNGLIVGGLRLDPLIVTLAAWIWARGLAVSLTGATTLSFDMGFVGFMNRPLFAGFTLVPIVIAGAFFAGWIILARLPLGLRIYAVGGDPRMLRQAGVGEGRLKLVILLVMSLYTAAGMLVMLGRLGAAAPTAGFGLELDAIVAVIIGGASFRGGTGRLRDTAIGVAFLAILNNGLSGLQMGDAQFFLIKGTLILAALTLRALPAILMPRGATR